VTGMKNQVLFSVFKNETRRKKEKSRFLVGKKRCISYIPQNSYYQTIVNFPAAYNFSCYYPQNLLSSQIGKQVKEILKPLSLALIKLFKPQLTL